MSRDWPQAFEPIRADFGYDRAADDANAQWLARRIAKAPYDAARVLDRARLQCQGRRVWVLGGAPSADADVLQVPPGDVLWTADGATLAAHHAGRVPHAIVTDLDGHPPVEALMARYGSVVFVHAHGDNRAQLDQHLSRFPPPRVAGTCQVEAPPPLLNPGGFTDGDRAVHLALHLGAADVRMVGFDFKTPGPFAPHSDPAIKRRKLAWARRLLDDLIASGEPVGYGPPSPPGASGHTPARAP